MGEKAEARNSRFRQVVGRWLAILFSIFVIYSMATLNIDEMKQLSVFLAFSLALTFIRHPIVPSKPGSIPLLVVDLVFSLFVIAMAVYIWVDYWEFIFRVGIPTNLARL